MTQSLPPKFGKESFSIDMIMKPSEGKYLA